MRTSTILAATVGAMALIPSAHAQAAEAPAVAATAEGDDDGEFPWGLLGLIGLAGLLGRKRDDRRDTVHRS